jgi:hypothetical protein
MLARTWIHKVSNPTQSISKKVTDDPVRVTILIANNFVEEMIESVIAQAVPNSECFDVPAMRYADKLKVLRALDSSITKSAIWQLMHKLNDLRAAAAHKDYQSRREKRFAELKKELLSTHPNTILPDEEALLNVVAALCFEYLSKLKIRFRNEAGTAEPL